MSFVPRDVLITQMLRVVQVEAERDPATALRGRLVCRGFRSGLLAAEARERTPVAELEQLVRAEIFGTPIHPTEEDDDEH